jgi:hypothetical protein
MGISSTEAEEMHTPSLPSKGKDGLSCEITRTCNPSVPLFQGHRGKTAAPSPSTLTSQGEINLTTGTFNLLSKTKSAIRLSGAFQSNLSAFALSVLETLGLKGSATEPLHPRPPLANSPLSTFTVC